MSKIQFCKGFIHVYLGVGVGEDKYLKVVDGLKRLGNTGLDSMRMLMFILSQVQYFEYICVGVNHKGSPNIIRS